MKLITLDPTNRQDDDIYSYSYDLEYLLNDRVVVFGNVLIPESIRALAKDLGCFQFSDDSFYIFLLMQDEASTFLAHCTGLTENKDFVLNRFG